jgi:hypothetical protein
MKRLINIVLLLFLSICISGQVVTTNVYFAPASGVAADYNAEYDTVLAAMTTNPTGDTLTWQNEMVDSLVSFGYWARMDILHVFANTINTDSEALINWIDPGTNDATTADSPIWTKRQGYKGSDSDNSRVVVANLTGASITNYTQDDATIGVYSRVDHASDANYELYGYATNYIVMRLKSSNLARLRLNSTAYLDVENTDAKGFYVGTRRGASEVEFYRNGSPIGDNTDASTGIPNSTIDLGKNTPSEFAIYFVMDAVSDAEVVILNRIFERYMDHLGTGIQ